MNKLLCIVVFLAVLVLAFATEPEAGNTYVATTNIDISFPTYLVVMNNYNLQQNNNMEYSKAYNNNYHYKPDIANYINVMSINEFSVNRLQGSDNQIELFRTINSVGAKYSPYIGVEAYLKHYSYSWNDSQNTTLDMNQIGFGLGLPNADYVRIFVYALSNDFSNSYANPVGENRFSGIKAQLAKRVVNRSQFSEFGVEYEDISYPEKHVAPNWTSQSSMFDRQSFSWSAHKRISGYLVSSSIKNPYLEPYTLRGLSSAINPLALVDEAGYLFSAKVLTQETYGILSIQKDTAIELGLPLNFTRFVGMNLGFQHQKLEVEYYNPSWVLGKNPSQDSQLITAGLRLALLGSGRFKAVGGADYYKATQSGSKGSEFINFSTDLVMHVSSHFVISAFFRHNNVWLPAQGAFETRALGYQIGSTLALRL